MSQGRTAGVDEAGRGALAGPVLAAAVILDPGAPISGLKDSKALTPLRREILAAEIRQKSRAFALGRAEAEEIDEINILQASLLAMRRAILGLPLAPDLALVDGNRLPVLPCRAEYVIGGDRKFACIMAASILAKVARDEEMIQLSRELPRYGFASHKGYGSARHLAALESFGASRIHRRSFAPVMRVL